MMTDYAELVRCLRGHSQRMGCDNCICEDADKRGFGTCSEELAKLAADAIEELQSVAEHYKGSADDWYKEACDYKAAWEKELGEEMTENTGIFITIAQMAIDAGLCVTLERKDRKYDSKTLGTLSTSETIDTGLILSVFAPDKEDDDE